MIRIALIGLLFLAALASLLPLPGSAGGATRSLALDATQFEFTPARITVNQGEAVTLILTASDVTHGFHLDGYGIERRVVPGIAETISFVADQPGTYRFRCSVSCGPLHPFMIGELVVSPNVPFWRAAGVVLAAFAAALVFAVRHERSLSS